MARQQTKAAGALVPTEAVIDVLRIERGEVEFYVLGRTPLILNRMSQKATHSILFPTGRMTTAQKATNLKHEPLSEYQASPYRDADPKAATLLLVLASAFKGAMTSAAIDMPGVTKAQIGRLTTVEGMYTPVWGVPQLLMATVRSADMNRTPDIRTRAILPRWAAKVVISYTRPLVTSQAVANLLAAAGVIRGVGDWRVEKGSGSFGQFELVEKDDARFQAIVKAGGRKAQEQAIEHPECYDAESTELFSWFYDEFDRRAQAGKAAVKKGGNGAAIQA